MMTTKVKVQCKSLYIEGVSPEVMHEAIKKQEKITFTITAVPTGFQWDTDRTGYRHVLLMILEEE